VDRGGRRVVDIRDVLAVDGATRWSTARDAAAGYLARRGAPLLRRRSRAESENLEVNVSCILSTGTSQIRSGLDVVVEGAAARVRNRATLERLAALWKSKLDWPFEVGDGAFRDGAGRTGLVFGVRPAKVLAFGKGEPFSQTRYTFDATRRD
jgi:hypothetical protein